MRGFLTKELLAATTRRAQRARAVTGVAGMPLCSSTDGPGRSKLKPSARRNPNRLHRAGRSRADLDARPRLQAGSRDDLQLDERAFRLEHAIGAFAAQGPVSQHLPRRQSISNRINVTQPHV